ncbi:putative two-component system sensor kinase [Actinokineospora spheciospongiae]|uniref:histidine kinase n=1 Tax=Actinokineospora spheciospongiae TaxID=909613 RepID=W7ITE8_9PSEU|nr:histidine kinase [Actinokineospora spheciospongiae]EWC60037.1 putative two-component system sensor kinase [Actinokineospora spheciospongiae]
MWDTAAALRRESLVVAVLCAVTDASTILLLCPAAGHSGWGPLALGLTVLADLALATPARFSGVVAAAHAALQVAGPAMLAGLGRYQGANETGLLVAGYRAGAWLGIREAVVVLAVLLVGALVGRVGFPPSEVGGDWRLVALHTLTTVVLPWLVGRNTTARRGHQAEVEQRETSRRIEERAAVRRAVAEERTAIARDLHDVISHHVSAIGVHAGAARLALGGPPGPVGRSLSAVETASRSAMADLRRMLDLLHHGDAATRQPGLDDLDDLVRVTRAAGLPTRLTTTGVAVDLPPSVDVALHRVAQEALTNALRHGGGEGAEVTLTRTDTEVVLTIANDLPPDAAPPGRRPAPAPPTRTGRATRAGRATAELDHPDAAPAHGGRADLAQVGSAAADPACPDRADTASAHGGRGVAATPAHGGTAAPPARAHRTPDEPDDVQVHRGLPGIRQRAALFGASVTCGPDGDRWVVRVTVPLEAR